MTVKAVRCDSVLRATISGRSSSSARSLVIGAQIRPEVCRDEERDLLRRGELGRHDQVALVLAVLVVDHDDDLAAAMAAIASSMVAAGTASSRGQPRSLRRSRPAWSSRSMYLAIMSTSRLTRSPAAFAAEGRYLERCGG